MEQLDGRGHRSLPSSRQQLSNDNFVDEKKRDYYNCSVAFPYLTHPGWPNAELNPPQLTVIIYFDSTKPRPYRYQ